MGLDQKAVETVRDWRFAPATKDGKPVAVQVNIEVNFRLF
jgi:protein TonB